MAGEPAGMMLAAKRDKGDSSHNERRTDPGQGIHWLVEDQVCADKLYQDEAQPHSDRVGIAKGNELQQAGQAQHGEEAGQVAHDLPTQEAGGILAHRRPLERHAADKETRQVHHDQRQHHESSLHPLPFRLRDRATVVAEYRVGARACQQNDCAIDLDESITLP